jgi:hypothetical protein
MGPAATIAAKLALAAAAAAIQAATGKGRPPPFPGSSVPSGPPPKIF